MAKKKTKVKTKVKSKVKKEKKLKLGTFKETEIGRAHVRTPVTEKSRMPSSA